MKALERDLEDSVLVEASPHWRLSRVETRAAASKHVKVLERAGLVRRTVRGRTHHCRLDAARLADAQKWIAFYQRFWNERLDALDTLLVPGGNDEDNND